MHIFTPYLSLEVNLSNQEIMRWTGFIKGTFTSLRGDRAVTLISDDT